MATLSCERKLCFSLCTVSRGYDLRNSGKLWILNISRSGVPGATLIWSLSQYVFSNASCRVHAGCVCCCSEKIISQKNHFQHGTKEDLNLQEVEHLQLRIKIDPYFALLEVWQGPTHTGPAQIKWGSVGRICGASKPWAWPGQRAPRTVLALTLAFGFPFMRLFLYLFRSFQSTPLLIRWGAEAFTMQVLAGAFALWKLFYLCWAGSGEHQTYLPFSSKRIQGQSVENVVWPVWKGAECLEAVYSKQAAAHVTLATRAVSGGVKKGLGLIALSGMQEQPVLLSASRWNNAFGEAFITSSPLFWPKLFCLLSMWNREEMEPTVCSHCSDSGGSVKAVKWLHLGQVFSSLN